MATSYQIEGNLTERQIESDVSAYLSWCSKGLPFRLLDVNEQATGADKLSDVTIPIYIQFKKSSGLTPMVAPPLRGRSNESPLQGIRRFRRRHGLADNPTLFFPLRGKAKNATEFQHNVLFAHNKPGSSYAIYVAPLRLDKDIYYAELCSGPRYVDAPWRWSRSVILDAWEFDWITRYDLQPFLKNHISITPHERVTSAKHFYAYSQSGDEVSWHSPEAVEGGPFRLSDFMSARMRDVLTGVDLASPEGALEVARSALSEFNVPAQDILVGDSAFDRLRSYGRWLWKAHATRQIIICASAKELPAGSPS